MPRLDGEMWVRKPTETLQFHINGQTKTVFPEAYDVAKSASIVHGSLLSIEENGVNLTDNTSHKKSIGFARIASGVTDPNLPDVTITPDVTEIEIQTYGRIDIPFTQFTSDLTAADIGKGIYAAASDQFVYKRGAGKLGGLTVDRTEAMAYNGAIIECGTVTAVDGDSAIIDVSLGGDSLGPAGTTQVEYTSNQLIGTRNTPRLYTYITNTQAKEHEERFEFYLPDAYTLSDLEDYWIAMDMFFGNPAGQDSTQKKTLVLYFTAETDAPTLANTATALRASGLGDETTPKTIPSINAEGKFKIGTAPNAEIVFVTIPSPGVDDRKTLINNLVEAVESVLGTMFDYSAVEDRRLVVTAEDFDGAGHSYSTLNVEASEASTLVNADDYRITFETVAATIGGAENGGILYIYHNPAFADEVITGHDLITYGELATGTGEYKVVPADRRRYVDTIMNDSPKLVNLVGALASPLPAQTPSTYIFRGQQVLLQKMGIVGGFSDLTVGEKVYLGYNGHVTQMPADITYDEYMVELGVAKSTTEIDLLIADPRLKSTTRDPIPVGVVSPRPVNYGGGYGETPPGFLALDGSFINPLEYPDLYYILQGSYPDENTADLQLADDDSNMIKAYSFSLYPNTATPEVPVSSRRKETSWRVLSGNTIDGTESFINVDHKLLTSVRDIVGYVLISVTDTAGAVGDIVSPISDAPQMILYPGFDSDSSDNVYGCQFEDDSLKRFKFRVANNGLRVINPSTDAMISVTTANASLIDASAVRFCYKVVAYKIENIYDFKDDHMIQKANDYWYTHRMKLYSNNSDVVHGVTASDSAGANTLCRRSASDEIEASSFNAVSKRSAKENIVNFEESALDLIKTVEVVKYNYKTDKEKNLKIGFIADDTHEYLSSKDHDKMEMGNSIGLLIKAVQELQKEIDNLKLHN